MERLRARISGAPAHPATGANVPAE
jgi:hypothetical protein